IATKEFFEASSEHFRTVEDPERRLRYRGALTVAIVSPTKTIVPTEFAETYLEVEDRQPFLTHLKARGIPELAFDKDSKLIDSQVRRIILRTSHNVRISGPAGVLEERVLF